MADSYRSAKKTSLAKKTTPTVFMFQPTAVRRVTTPRLLAQWEKDLRERVGFKGDLSGLIASATECCCPDTDDCDQ